MSENVEARNFAAGLIRLLVEYSDKLQRRATALERARRSTTGKFVGTQEWQSFNQEFMRLNGALRELANAASQLVTAGQLSDLYRIELKVRLAEFEGLHSAFQTRLMVN